MPVQQNSSLTFIFFETKLAISWLAAHKQGHNAFPRETDVHCLRCRTGNEQTLFFFFFYFLSRHHPSLTLKTEFDYTY